jgi:hypothetical protein
VAKRPLTFKEARETKQLDRFAREHPAEGSKQAFDKLLNAMAKGHKRDEKTANKKPR